MKKILLLVSAISMAIGLAACSSNDTTKKDTNKATAPAKTDVKKELVKFYMALSKTINAKDVDLNNYEKAAMPDKTLQPKASESAAAVAETLKTVQVPAGLKDQKAEIEAALKDITDSYQAKADELKKDAPSLDAANATFVQGDEKLGKVFEEVKLLKPSIGKEVN